MSGVRLVSRRSTNGDQPEFAQSRPKMMTNDEIEAEIKHLGAKEDLLIHFKV
jgi:hypothetical protein